MKRSKSPKSKKRPAPHRKPVSSKARKSDPPFAFKDLLSLREPTVADLEALFRLTAAMKKDPAAYGSKLRGKSIALLFQKPSVRTRISFEIGMSQLGGSSSYMSPEESPLGQRESVKDVARVLSRYCDAIVTRTYLHSDVEEVARHADVPVVNGLSDGFHPCQTLADLFTLRERFKTLTKLNLAYVGDGNNVLNSLLYGCAKTGANLAVATPRGYEPSEEVLREIKLIAKETGSKITVTNNPFTTIKNAHAIYTDVWVSMGQEKQREQRLRDFQPFQINSAILGKAPKDAFVLHCLPAHRGEEITDEVMESGRCIVFDQAENRLHTQKALLTVLLTRKARKG